MPLDLDTSVRRIDLTSPGLNLAKRIKDICDTEGSRDEPRRLAAAFESQSQVILIFQRDFTAIGETSEETDSTAP